KTMARRIQLASFIEPGIRSSPNYKQRGAEGVEGGCRDSAYRVASLNMNFPRYMGCDLGGTVLALSTGYGRCSVVGNPQMSPVRMSTATFPYTCAVPSGLRSMV